MGLVLETLQLLGIQRRREGQHLQRHPPTQRNLLRFVYDAHAVAADLPQDTKITQCAGDRPFSYRSWPDQAGR